MRIISGTARGRKLFSPPTGSKDIRPTADRQREALFSILGGSVEGALVLDLFAGTGAVGLEAYSRGAQTVVFCDNNPRALQLIDRNVQQCLRHPGDRNNLIIFRHDLTKGLPDKLFKRLHLGTFDLVFADPPYGRNFSLAVLSQLGKTRRVAENGRVVIEEHVTIDLPTRVDTLALFDKRRYGETVFWFYRQLPAAAGILSINDTDQECD